MTVVASTPAVVAIWATLNRKADRSSWFEFGHGQDGLSVKQCENVGHNHSKGVVKEEVLCSATVFLTSKMLLMELNAIFIVVKYVVGFH